MTTRRLIKKAKRALRRHPRRTILYGAVLLCALIVIGYSIHMITRRKTVNIDTYAPTLALIGEAESSNNYNAYFGEPRNNTILFTEMTVAQVLDWQDEFIASGSPSSAVGRYQIITTTLRDLVDSGAVKKQAVFDKTTQDHLAITLLSRRGGEAYVNKELTAKEYAANLAKEWASLPKMMGRHPEKSYYESNLNSTHVTPEEIMKTVSQIEPE